MKVNLKRKLSIMLAVALVAVAFAVPVSAAGTSEGTDASVNFMGGNIDFNDGTATNVPPTLNFGKHKITSDAFSYTIGVGQIAKTQTALDEGEEDGKVDGTLSVTDNRGVNGDWDLTLELGDFENGGVAVMPGANMDFEIHGWSKKEASNTSAVPTPVTGVNLTAGGGTAKSITTAAAGAGTGAWLALEDDGGGNLQNAISATLNIPSEMRTGSNVANLTWTLLVTP